LGNWIKLASPIVISLLLLIPLSAYAKDLVVNSECEGENWKGLITDKEGNPLTNVQVGTIKKISSSSLEDIFYTDENGIVIINYDYLTGFVKITKGGYNAMKIATEPCVKPPEFSLNGQNFQKQTTDLYLVKHLAFAAGWYLPGYGEANSIIAGDIVNLSNFPLTDIVISVKTFKNGKILEDASSWYPIKKILMPGEASPFVIQPLLSSFDDYEIWISDYKFSDKVPKKPSIDIIELDVQRNFEKWDTYTIKCVESGVYPSASFLLIWYNESGYIYSIEFYSPEYPDKDDCRINGNRTSTFPYFDMPSDDSFEFFLIEGPRNLLFSVEEIRKLNPVPYVITQSETYSTYYPNSLRPKYMDGITKIQSFLTNSNLDQDKSTIIERTPENNLPELGTYNILVRELPKNWEKDYGNILANSLKFWEESFDKIKFNRVTYWQDADFVIDWASTFSDGLMGYYGCCDDFGANKVVITLGYFDEEKNWILTDRDYAEEILKHETGHAIGLKHTYDADDIMYAYIYDYEKWQKLDKIKKEFVTDESKSDIPNWIRNNAKWWSEGKIEDNDFVSGIQFLIKEKIMQIPQTAKAPISTGSEEIPSWIKNNAEWWSQGLISDDDFVKGIQYLIEQGIIQVS